MPTISRALGWIEPGKYSNTWPGEVAEHHMKAMNSVVVEMMAEDAKDQVIAAMVRLGLERSATRDDLNTYIVFTTKRRLAGEIDEERFTKEVEDAREHFRKSRFYDGQD